MENMEIEPVAPSFQVKLEDWLGQQFNHLIYRGRFLIIAAFVAWTCYAASKSVTLSKLTKKEDFVPDDHADLRALNLWLDNFVDRKDHMEPIVVDIIFGVKGIDRSGGSFQEKTWDPYYLGEIVWDDAFDIADPSTQVYIQTLCSRAQNSPLSNGMVGCWIDLFSKFIRQ